MDIVKKQEIRDLAASKGFITIDELAAIVGDVEAVFGGHLQHAILQGSFFSLAEIDPILDTLGE